MKKLSLLPRAIGSICALATLSILAAPGFAQIPNVDERTRGLERIDGFVPFYHDAESGKLFLEVADDLLERDILYLTSLATGIGSLELGLDRGTIGEEAVVRFQRVDSRIFLVRQNPAFRALHGENEMLELSVRESFPTSVLAALEISARDDDRTLVDATSLFLRDAMNVSGALRDAEQGDFSLDLDRSAIYAPRTRAFPKNTEVEVTLTYASADPGREITRHAPEGRSLTLRQHHSLVELPEPYTPRAFHPRIGLFSVLFRDYSGPLTDSYTRRWIARWRLEKVDPEADISEPRRPIIYYLDRGIPEPYRSAFREGAMWWNQVFEAAGFRDAFRVEDLPEGVDPMDARYSVIQWVHRTEPGFSIGPSFVDPRTGEILKAAVRMDSHRSLVDFNLWAGMKPAVTSTDAASDLSCEYGGYASLPDWVARLDPNTDPVDFAMARRRQHAAHEVGHTLGLAHNFTASTYGRASVMDYPAPRVLIEDGSVDLSQAYRPGSGAYDSLAIRYAYTEFPDGGEAEGLAAIVSEAIEDDLLFITDVHARPAGASDPRATLWDDGDEAVSAFTHALNVRRLLLDRFDESAIAEGEPLALLRDRLAPVYLHHRYALDAATRTIGGMEFTYAVRGDGQTPTRIIPAARQRAALDAVLRSLRPEQLIIPESVLRSLAPYPYGYAAPRRGFESAAEPAFDQLGAARTLATMVVERLLQPQRAARLIAFESRQTNALTLHELMDALVEHSWRAPAASGAAAAVQRVTQRVVVDELLKLAADDEATVEARALAEWHLARIGEAIASGDSDDPLAAAHRAYAARDIRRFLTRPAETAGPSQALPPPPGSPIGDR